MTVAQNGVIELTRDMRLSNDSDADGDRLEIKGFTRPLKGMMALNAQKDLVYRAPEGFLGTDTFTYTVGDAEFTDSATVSVVVTRDYSVDLNKTHYVNYRLDATELTNSSALVVAGIIRALKARPEYRVSIEAYTDSSGSAAYNLGLSQRRANATRDLLVRAGIAAARIEIFAGGEDKPLVANDNAEGRAINRRGEFRFYPVRVR